MFFGDNLMNFFREVLLFYNVFKNVECFENKCKMIGCFGVLEFVLFFL